MTLLQKKMRVFVSFLVLSLSAGPLLAAPDYGREKRWADEVVPGLIVGEAIYLAQQNGHPFLGILAEEDDAEMALVVAHGMGLHPDSGMIGTLRQRLFDHGYTTLSIQMPVLAATAGAEAYPALFPDAVERLQIAVAYLKQKGYKKIAIVSHSNGSRMSRRYMKTNPTDVNAWAAISLTQGDTFTDIKAPIFDLYGSNDLPHVLASTKKRQASLSNNASRQVVISGADHFFAGHEEAMVSAVKNFLDGIK